MKLLILFVIFGFVAAELGVYQQPLIRVESRKEKMIKAGTWDAYYKNKQLLQQSLDNKHFYVEDFDEVGHVADLYIGTPRQAFKFHYSLVSFDFWVTDITCGTDVSPNPYCPGFCYNPNATSFCDQKCIHGKTTELGSTEEICAQKSKYDSSKSSTIYHPEKPSNSHRDYEYGYISFIHAGDDKIALGAVDSMPHNLEIRLQQLMQTTSMSPVFADTPFDGILGIGLNSVFILQTPLYKKNFTIYLQDTDGKYDVPGGYITFGGLDEEHCSSEIEYPGGSSIRFAIQNVSFGTPINSTQTSSFLYEALVDTGRTSIVGPPEIIKSFKEAVGAGEDGKIDCNAKINDLTFKMGGLMISRTIPAKHMIIKNSDGSCNIALDSMPPSMDYNNRWIFGVPWFRSYCSIFDFSDSSRFAVAEIIVKNV